MPVRGREGSISRAAVNLNEELPASALDPHQRFDEVSLNDSTLKSLRFDGNLLPRDQQPQFSPHGKFTEKAQKKLADSINHRLVETLLDAVSAAAEEGQFASANSAATTASTPVPLEIVRNEFLEMDSSSSNMSSVTAKSELHLSTNNDPHHSFTAQKRGRQTNQLKYLKTPTPPLSKIVFFSRFSLILFLNPSKA